MALLPSFNALGDGKCTVECEDMFLAPLASGKFKDAFITEVTPPAAIAVKTVKFWEHVNAALENRKIPQDMAVPQHRLGLIALYDTNTRAQTGLYKLRVATKYRKLISAALTANCVVAGWPDTVPGPLRSGGHAVERVLDVRRAGPRSYQVLLRWRGAHDDEWRPMAACNDLTKREAQLLIKRKFPPRPSGCDEAVVAGAQRRTLSARV